MKKFSQTLVTLSIAASFLFTNVAFAATTVKKPAVKKVVPKTAPAKKPAVKKVVKPTPKPVVKKPIVKKITPTKPAAKKQTDVIEDNKAGYVW